MPLLANILYRLYATKHEVVRGYVLNQVCRMEKGEFYSETLRRIFKDFHKVNIGLYTHGGCFMPGAFDQHSTIGRYCSIAKGARGMNRNHPMDFRSTHAFFFNPKLGYCDKDLVNFIPLEIGNDVWIGTNALILPHVRTIGNGAVIAAGAVVNKDVPPYAVAVGNPARVVRFRFPESVINELLHSKWWEKPITELNVTEFSKPHFVGSSREEISAF